MLTLLLRLVLYFLIFLRLLTRKIIYKLKSVGVTDSLLRFIESFLSNRFQRVLLNGQTSEWLPVKAVVPQDSILGPFFPLFILMAYQAIYYEQ